MSDPVTPCPIIPPAPRARPAVPVLMVRYSGTPIRHTDFGIRNSEIGNRGTGNLHGAVFSLLTTMEMVR
jgi:hypothetical protein